MLLCTASSLKQLMPNLTDLMVKISHVINPISTKTMMMGTVNHNVLKSLHQLIGHSIVGTDSSKTKGWFAKLNIVCK